jgi:iron complex transport system ATP-binding protein
MRQEGPGELAVRDLSAVLGGRTVLRGIDLVLPPGQLTALIGPNGAGKSTLLGALAGDLPPASGQVTLGGRSLARWAARDLAQVRAVLPQRPGVCFSFTVRQVVELGRHPHRRSWRAGRTGPAGNDEALVDAALAEVGLGGFAERPIDTLSGGEAARVHLARVLAQQAAILLLDEPTATLDLHHQHLVLGIARRHASAGGTAVVVLHDLNLAAAYADRIVLLAGGCILADGPSAAVLTPKLIAAAYDHPVEVLCHPRQRWRVVVADRLDPGSAAPTPPPPAMNPAGRGQSVERTEDHGPARPT